MLEFQPPNYEHCSCIEDLSRQHQSLRCVYISSMTASRCIKRHEQIWGSSLFRAHKCCKYNKDFNKLLNNLFTVHLGRRHLHNILQFSRVPFFAHCPKESIRKSAQSKVSGSTAFSNIGFCDGLAVGLSFLLEAVCSLIGEPQPTRTWTKWPNSS